MEQFIVTLLLCSASMSALVLLYLAITPALAKRYSAKGRYYAWLIIIVGLIIPFRPQFQKPIISVSVPTVAAPYVQVANGTPVYLPHNAIAQSTPQHNILWWQVATVVWISGAGVFMVYHVVKHIHFAKMAKRWSEQVTDEQTLTMFRIVKMEMGISKKIDLFLCPIVGSPTMLGFFSPRILIPTTDLAKDELEFICRHELIHYKRKDLWYKSLVLVATAIHWFNPLVYLMAQAINILCEVSCDTEVVRDTDAVTRQHYSETIIGVVKYQSKLKTALSTNFYGGKKGMKNRIFSIMDTGKKKVGIVIICSLLFVTLGTGFTFAVNAAQPAPDTSNAQTDEPAASGEFTMISKYDEESGQTYYSWDGGSAWFPTSDIEWWTYDEYEAWMENERIHMQELVESEKGLDALTGWFTWTQNDIDEMMALYEQTLEELKNGYMVSKIAYGDENLALSYNPDDIGTKGDYSIYIGLDNGTEITFGPYDTKAELLSVVVPYCEEQLQAKTMSQSEFDEILDTVNSLRD